MVSAPSGVGKTTVIKAAMRKQAGLRFSVSCTTRPPRSGEVPGEDYHFISREEFARGIEKGRFLEWAEVHGEYYGTDGDQVKAGLQAGDDVLLDIDVQGARQVRCSYPSALNIFVLPPSMDVLRNRLEARGTESPEKLARRLAAAESELADSPWYDYVIVNDLLEDAVTDLVAVIRAARCRIATRGPRLREFLRSFGKSSE